MAKPKKEVEKMSAVPDDVSAKDTKGIIKSIRNSLNKDDADHITWDLTKDDSPTHVKSFISTGSTLLDIIVSNRANGGIPCGKLTEIQGEEASGKSLLAAHIIVDTQKKGGIAVYLDTENAANPDFMRRIGVDLEKLVYIQPGTIEKAFETMEDVIKVLKAKDATRAVTIIWDSVGNTPPQAEIEGDYDPNSRMGLGAKAMAKGLRKITDLIGREQITLVFTNPLKFAMGGSPYADPFITPYGKAVPYHASARIRLTSSTKLKDAKTQAVYGLVTNGRIIKSRLGPGHRSVKFQIHFDHGIDDEQSWYDVLHDGGLIECASGWCYINSLPSGKISSGGKWEGKDRGAQFRELGFGQFMRENPAARAWAKDALEKLLIIKYDDTRPAERDLVAIPNDEASPEGPVA